MKLNLASPGTKGEHRLLFSNLGRENPNEFYLLMTFHKSRKGGFSRSVTVEECQKALSRRNKKYKYVNYNEGEYSWIEKS